ncbi:beta-galactosidase family protein [Salix suchowensis]|nr:beta-galactosidase family protein [Salix suchowensis]
MDEVMLEHSILRSVSLDVANPPSDGDPSRISLVKRSVASVCAEVTEFHPTIKNWHIESYGRAEEFHSPKVLVELSARSMPCFNLLCHPREEMYSEAEVYCYHIEQKLQPRSVSKCVEEAVS